MNLKVNDGLWVTMVCQYGLTDWNKGTTLVGMWITGEGGHVWGREEIGTLCFLLNFAVSLRLS